MKYTRQFFENLLRERDLKATQGRVALIEYLFVHPEPMSAKTITRGLEGEYDLATIYRTLQKYCEKSIVRRVDLRSRHVQYELTLKDHHHHHIVCTECGTLEELAECGLTNVINDVLKKSSTFTSVKDHTFELFSTCKSCVYK